MTYSTVNVQLTPSQIKKLQSKTSKECGTTITLKSSQMSGGQNKLSLTATQVNQYNNALARGRGIRLNLSKAAVNDVITNGGILPLIPIIAAAVGPALAAAGKAAVLGAVGTAAGIGLKKALGQGYRKKKGGLLPSSIIPGLIASIVPALAGMAARRKATGQGYKKRKRSKTRKTANVLVEKSLANLTIPMSNFDLIEAVKKLKIKNFRGVFMRDQLPENSISKETGIINLDNNEGPGTHWVAYAIDPRSIIYFDSYGLAPPNEFLKYIKPN